MIVRRAVHVLDERLKAAPFLRKALRHAFPDHWSFMLGEVAMYCFIFIVATGTFLAFFFHPSDADVTYLSHSVPSLYGRSMSDAYASVLRLSFDVRAGLVIRQAHHWCAVLFAAAVATHMARVFFTGAFRKPRDLNWIIGLTLFLLVMADGFTGYSLPDDALSGAGLRIADSIAIAIPFIGGWVGYLFFGGRFPTPEIANRLYILHVFAIPLLIAALIGGHLALIWVQKHTQFRGPHRTETNVVGSPLWPTYALKSLALMMATFGGLLLLGATVEINPIWDYGPYEPYKISSPAQPDWYVGWLDGALRVGPPYAFALFGHRVSALLWPGLVLPAVYFGILYLWPLIERKLTGDEASHELLQLPWENPLRLGVGIALVSFGIVLLGAGSDDIQARFFRISVQRLAWFYRFGVWIVPLALGALAFHVGRELEARGRYKQEHPVRVLVRRNEAGGYEEQEISPG